MTKVKTVCITFLGNPYHDTRVSNLQRSLKQNGMEVKIIAFDWQTPQFKTVRGDTTIYKLTKSKFSLIFYFKFILLLLKTIPKIKADFYFAEDIYVLPITLFIAHLRGVKIAYNSRELYSHVGGLSQKKKRQWLLSLLEKLFIKKADIILTTGELDANYLEKVYGVSNLHVLRNLPEYKPDLEKINLHKLLKIPDDRFILLYQGVLHGGRGISLVLNAIKDLPAVHFVIIGEGVYKDKLLNESIKLGIKNRVHFLGSVNQNELLSFTKGADLGVALIENISLSYYYALPNKLFEYIMASVPVLVTNLPQMAKVVEAYKVGEIVKEENPDEVKTIIKKLMSSRDLLLEYKQNCIKASKELNWEVEFENLKNSLFK